MTKYEQAVELWRARDIQSAEDLDKQLDCFRVLFAYNTSRMENPEVTYDNVREVFQNDRVIGFSGSPATLTEIGNQKKCYEFLLPKIVAAEPISLSLIQEVHFMTTMATYDNRLFFGFGERPGVFKKHDFVIGKNEVGSQPEDVETDLSGLIDVLKDAGRLSDPIKLFKAATYFHMLFEHTHPFADGNGRVGRTMMNYFLMINNHPPLIIHNENRIQYYEALEQFDDAEDIEPLFDFLTQQFDKTWAKTLKRWAKSEAVDE